MQKSKRNRTSAHFIYIFLFPRPESPWPTPEDPLTDLEIGCARSIQDASKRSFPAGASPAKSLDRLPQCLVDAGGDILDRAHAVDFDQLFLRLVVGQ